MSRFDLFLESDPWDSAEPTTVTAWKLINDDMDLFEEVFDPLWRNFVDSKKPKLLDDCGNPLHHYLDHEGKRRAVT